MRRTTHLSRTTVLLTAVLGMVATLLVSVTRAPIAEAQTAEDLPGEGDELDVEYYAEPEFLLTAGAERWNIVNTPDGTVAAGYGRPDDAVHDGYAKTARYDPMVEAPPAGSIVDVTIRKPIDSVPRPLAAGDPQPDPAQLNRTWAFVQRDDGVAEVWGPMEEGFTERYVLRAPVDITDGSLVGGTVVSDALVDGRWVPRSFVVEASGVELHYVGGAEDTSVPRRETGRETIGVAVADFEHAVAGFQANVSANGTSAVGPFGLDKNRGAALLVTLEADRSVVRRIDRGAPGPRSEGFAVPMSTLTPLFDSTRSQRPGPILVELGFSCHYVLPALNQDKTGPEVAGVADALGCEDGAAERRDALGALSIAVGVSDEASAEVVAAHVLDAQDETLFRSGGTTTSNVLVTQFEVACELGGGPDALRPGSFDLRMHLSATHIGCVEDDFLFATDTQVRVHEYHHGLDLLTRRTEQTDDSITPESGFDTRNVVRGNQGSSFFVTTRDVDSGLDPDAAPSSRVTRSFAFEDLQSPTIQVQLPCASLLPRRFSRNGQQGEPQDLRALDCVTDLASRADDTVGADDVIEVAGPRNAVSFTVAAYGRPGPGAALQPVVDVVGAERLARTQALIRCLRGQGRDSAAGAEVRPCPRSIDDEEPDLDVTPSNRLGWTVQPTPYLASDLAALREDPTAVDPRTFPRFQAAAPPPPLLLHRVGRAERKPLRVRLTSDAKADTVAKPTMPLAVLQAPPIVAGLGQQTDFTPSFASSDGSSETAVNGKSTRVGAHVDAEVTVMAGPTGVKAGGGASFGYQFMQEVEEQIARTASFSTTEVYGGSFADHVVVTRQVEERVWDAVIVDDPSGFGAGQPFEYGQVVSERTASRLLSDLAEDAPALYGPDGLFRRSIDVMVNRAVPGDVRTYLPGAALAQPTSILRSEGGPCNGGYAAPNTPTPDDGRLPSPIPADNPYDRDPAVPEGPDVVLSDLHGVDAGNDVTEGAVIEIGAEEVRSGLVSRSHDFSFSLIAKLELGDSEFSPVQVSAELAAGVDGGYTTSIGYEDVLSSGSSVDATIGNIPTSQPWAEGETYDWKMFFCKAQIGTLGTGTEVFVQGYLVDGYTGFGGLEPLGPVAPVHPAPGDVVRVDPDGSLAVGDADAIAPGTCADRPQDLLDEFTFDPGSRSVRSFVLEVEDVVTGERVVVPVGRPEGEVEGNDPDDPRTYLDVPVPDCLSLTGATFPEDSSLRWRVTTEGFLDDLEVGPWTTFRAQALPSEVPLAGLRPLMLLSDDSVLVDVEDPEGVRSYRHRVRVFDAEGNLVEEDTFEGRYFRTEALAPGDHRVVVEGFNDHRDAEGGIVHTDPLEQTITVDERLRAQFTWSCPDDRCTSVDDVQLGDLSLPGGDVPITDWFWTFGDGDTSQRRNPAHRFPRPADDAEQGFDVTLFVTDAANRTDQVTQFVPILPPIADLAVSGSGGGEAFLGRTETFGLRVDDLGPQVALADEADPITVDIELPEGLEPTSIGGSGWACEVTVPTATCERTLAIQAGGFAPAITIQAPITEANAPGGTITATVSQGVSIDPDVTNDVTAIDFTTAEPPPPPPPPPPPGPVTPPGPPAQSVTDDDPGDSARTISERRFGPGEATHAVLARDDVFADALAGSVLLGDGPILFTGGDSLDPGVETELDRVLPTGATVYVLGGEAALSTAVEDRVRAMGLVPVRLAGENRVETSVAVADEAVRLAGADPAEVILARHDDWADAVTAGAWAADTGTPLLLTPTGVLHPAVDAWLAAHPGTDPVVIGGEAAISEVVRTAAGAARIAGENRFETAAAIVDRRWPAASGSFLIANGRADDAWTFLLGASGLAADTDSPPLLVFADRVPDATEGVLCAGGTRATTTVIGSLRLVGQDVRDQLGAAC